MAGTLRLRERLPAAARLQSLRGSSVAHGALGPCLVTWSQVFWGGHCLAPCLVPAWVHTKLLAPQGFRLHTGAVYATHPPTLSRVLPSARTVLSTDRAAPSTVRAACMRPCGCT